jgi:hypothetical protein
MKLPVMPPLARCWPGLCVSYRATASCTNRNGTVSAASSFAGTEDEVERADEERAELLTFTAADLPGRIERDGDLFADLR